MLPNPQKDNLEKKEEADNEMSFLEHLEELRWHIIRSVLSIGIFASIIYIFSDWVFKHIIIAPKEATFPTYRLLHFEPSDFQLIQTQFGEQFFIDIKVAIWMGFILSFPYIFYEFWKFIKPGLYDKERKAARGSVFICSSLFISGVLFGYYIIAPFAVSFLGGYSVSAEVTNSSTISSYVNYIAMFTIPTGIIFQLPVVIYFFSKIGLVTPEFLRKYRKHAIVIILIFASIITPPDVITQILIGVPILFLYEIGIHVSKRVIKKAKEKNV